MEWLKKLLTNIWFYVVLFVLSLVIPFGINEAYQYGQETGNGYITIWGADEVFGFFGDYLSFFGTVILGAAAVFQTERANELAKKATEQADKANELAAQMQKLEQAKFVSMVSLAQLYVNKRGFDFPNYRNPDIPNPEKLHLTANGYKCSNCYHIDAIFQNDSEFPIVQIAIHAGQRKSVAGTFYGMEDINTAIYIPSHGSQAVRFIVPSAIFEEFKQYGLALSINFINVFDYATPATLHIEDMEHWNVKKDYAYRIAKFIDVKPQKSEQNEKEAVGTP